MGGQHVEKRGSRTRSSVSWWALSLGRRTGGQSLHRVIRHRLAPHKKMMRVMTHSGLVDVTDDHSLLLNNGLLRCPRRILLLGYQVSASHCGFVHRLQTADSLKMLYRPSCILLHK